MNEELEKFRYIGSQQFTTRNGDNFGLFYIKYRLSAIPLKTISSPLGESDWDHVSVSLPNRCPTWDEMCFVKDLFWRGNETIIQFHPKKSEYINNHRYCLHLWKNNKKEIELPPSILVGIK